MPLGIFEGLRVDDIPNFLKARSAAGLRRAMLRNNVRLKGFVKYFDVQWNAEEKRWYAWYFSSISRDENMSVDDQVELAKGGE